jgi:hypothetical protein
MLRYADLMKVERVARRGAPAHVPPLLRPAYIAYVSIRQLASAYVARRGAAAHVPLLLRPVA